ncbi:hypothetical protein Pelo_5259 [Pelomyxa schiedti]|nr:hypothetical protein Pelo_5259 [Pelomyxa schiedti]
MSIRSCTSCISSRRLRSLALPVALLLSAVAIVSVQGQPASTCCSSLREKEHIGRYCGLDRDVTTCGYKYNTMCHEWNDHGQHINTATKVDLAVETMINDDGEDCLRAWLTWECSLWCVTCTEGDDGAWTYHGACSNLCDDFKSKCPTLVTNPDYGSIFTCNSSLYNSDLATCNKVKYWDNTQNNLGWGLMSATVFTLAGIIVAGFIWELWGYNMYQRYLDKKVTTQLGH